MTSAGAQPKPKGLRAALPNFQLSILNFQHPKLRSSWRARTNAYLFVPIQTSVAIQASFGALHERRYSLGALNSRVAIQSLRSRNQCATHPLAMLSFCPQCATERQSGPKDKGHECPTVAGRAA